MQLISFILAGWITKFRFWLKDNKKPFIQKMKPIHALIIFSAGIVAALITTLILSALNIMFAGEAFMTEYAAVAEGYNINIEDVWRILLLAVIVDPFIEELICRFMLNGIIDNLFKIRVFTIIGSSMIFAALHEGIVQQVYAFIFGVIMSILYYYGPDVFKQCKGKKFREIYMGISNYNNRNLLRSYLFHMGFNLTGVTVALISIH